MSGEDVTREKVEQLRKDFDSHETSQSEEQVRMWKAINDLRNRLPLWATFTFGALMGICGWMASALS